jgi:hypothetical protein
MRFSVQTPEFREGFSFTRLDYRDLVTAIRFSSLQPNAGASVDARGYAMKTATQPNEDWPRPGKQRAVSMALGYRIAPGENPIDE